jgi:hypothetical protein
LQKAGEHYDHEFTKRCLVVKKERANPPPMVKKANFCNIAETTDETANE